MRLGAAQAGDEHRREADDAAVCHDVQRHARRQEALETEGDSVIEH